MPPPRINPFVTLAVWLIAAGAAFCLLRRLDTHTAVCAGVGVLVANTAGGVATAARRRAFGRTFVPPGPG